MIVTTPLNDGRQLLAEVDPACADSARALCQRLGATAESLPESQAIDAQVEWAKLRLVAEPGAVRVEEPDYRSDATQFVRSLRATAWVFALQAALTARLNVPPLPLQASHYVRVERAALTAVSVVGKRLPDMQEPISGWQIVCAAPPQPPHEHGHGQYSAVELAALRLAWMVPLCLPLGWAFRCVGQTLVEVVSPDQRSVTVMLSLDV